MWSGLWPSVLECLLTESGLAAVVPFDRIEDDYLSEVAVVRLEVTIGYRFSQRSFLLNALAHRSWVAEHPETESNERLEFLGDAVLGMVVTDALYSRWPDLAEGVLAKARSALVSAEFLADAAFKLDLGSFVLLGKGEAVSGGREKPSIVADAIEALIGAIYLDGGLDAATPFVLSLVSDELDEAVSGEGSRDFKTRLQERSVAFWGELPVYATLAHGPDHAKRFEASVTIGGELIGRGEGRSKKQAEQDAARNVWEDYSPRWLEENVKGDDADGE